jgi:hypothetical protein
MDRVRARRRRGGDRGAAGLHDPERVARDGISAAAGRRGERILQAAIVDAVVTEGSTVPMIAKRAQTRLWLGGCRCISAVSWVIDFG